MYKVTRSIDGGNVFSEIEFDSKDAIILYLQISPFNVVVKSIKKKSTNLSTE